MSERPLWALTATEAGALMENGALSAETLLRACISRIEAREPALKAWVHLDPLAALAKARDLDKRPRIGPLHGITIAIKDVIDTADMPTAYNSVLYEGHRPAQDAACVATLRAAGALIIGKTDTTEFAAAGRDAATGNPADLTRTAGGSSSGSAAAVADSHVPLALGTQTGGSTIRPASFCGAHGFKPSWGAVSREGAKFYSVSLDTIGWFARSVADLGLLADVFGIEDDEPAEEKPLKDLHIAACRSPVWDCADEAAQDVFEAGVAALRAAGVQVSFLGLDPMFDGLAGAHKTILFREGGTAFLNLYRSAPHLLHDDFKRRVESRAEFSNADLRAAYDLAARCRIAFDDAASAYDAVLTPSAPGEAPIGRRPGDPIMNQMWTLLHTPCVNLPGFLGPNGLPIGLTLTGPRFTDRRVLTVARAVEPVFARQHRSHVNA